MKRALQFGAGSIGRGFIGQLLARSGYEVVFAEVDAALVGALNASRRYPVRVVGDEGDSETFVENVRAVNAADSAAVAKEIAGSEIVATAVGAAALPRVAPALAAGLAQRWRTGILAPLNVILCENLADSDAALRSLVLPRLEGADRERAARLVGFVRASVGRMVPVMTDAMREGNVLRIWVEAYDRLPVDAEAFVGKLPDVLNMEPVAPFQVWVERKLYIHNLGHAAIAYLGALRGYRHVWEAVADLDVAREARLAMAEAAAAISAEHGVGLAPLLDHAEDLLSRFANRKLGDTIERVGRDLPRKLGPKDRLAGALGLCARRGLPRGHIAGILAAALLFDDTASGAVRDEVSRRGPAAALTSYCGLGAGSPDLELIVSKYAELRATRA